MNFPTHDLHMTWPQGMVSMAFNPLLSPFLQAGQISAEVSVAFEVVEGADSDDEVLNVMGMRVFRESGCEWVVDDAGHIGLSFSGLVDEAGPLVLLEGVREGTQKEGSVGLAAWKSEYQCCKIADQYSKRVIIPFPHPSPSLPSPSPLSRSSTSPPRPTQTSSSCPSRHSEQPPPPFQLHPHCHSSSLHPPSPS